MSELFVDERGDRLVVSEAVGGVHLATNALNNRFSPEDALKLSEAIRKQAREIIDARPKQPGSEEIVDVDGRQLRVEPSTQLRRVWLQGTGHLGLAGVGRLISVLNEHKKFLEAQT